ncbi:MAG: hypothetical protein U9P00_07440, partial [Pseudomonadota bacterium]|nr:hypothetical protein [Pseudomonadota bacterium]
MERNGLSGVNLTGIIVAVFILASSLLYKPPLAPERPSVSPDIPEPTISREDVPARLWEDPFAAIRRSLDQRRELASVDGGNRDKRVHTPENLEKYLEELLGPAGEKSNLKLTVLVAMVPGGPYAENREFRRRVRYAVLSGLSSSGFTPNDELHVGFWQHPKTDAAPA